MTATVMGNTVATLFDVGVAGIHRILMQSQKLREATVIIVVAGMEGALASVVGGMVDVPGDRRAHLHRVRCEFRRCLRAAGDAELLRIGSHRREHRQRIRRGVCGRH